MTTEEQRKVVRVRLSAEERVKREAERLERSRKAKLRALQSYERQKAAVAKLEGKARLRDRKLETRLKIILGAYVLRHMEQDVGFAAQVTALVHRAAEPAEAQLFVDQLKAITARREAEARKEKGPLAAPRAQG